MADSDAQGMNFANRKVMADSDAPGMNFANRNF
jgi:hypothetical protein